VVRAWAIVPAAVNERDPVPGLIDGAHELAGLLTDKGFTGRQFAESMAAQGISILLPPTKATKHGENIMTALRQAITGERGRHRPRGHEP
jgi:hypothetical protein